MSRFGFLFLTAATGAVFFLPAGISEAQGQCCLTHDQLSGRRSYRLYPYTFSYGNRVDPFWSYTASYFPYTYQGDGSYYGLGYSGYGGRGAHGNYWYW